VGVLTRAIPVDIRHEFEGLKVGAGPVGARAKAGEDSLVTNDRGANKDAAGGYLQDDIALGIGRVAKEDAAAGFVIKLLAEGLGDEEIAGAAPCSDMLDATVEGNRDLVPLLPGRDAIRAREAVTDVDKGQEGVGPPAGGGASGFAHGLRALPDRLDGTFSLAILPLLVGGTEFMGDANTGAPAPVDELLGEVLLGVVAAHA
jgi:hypothetical protein